MMEKRASSTNDAEKTAYRKLKLDPRLYFEQQSTQSD
jgi:hypothetical protein